LNKGISPAQLIRLLGVLNPIMQAVSDIPKPQGYFTEIVADTENKRWVVICRVAYANKEDAERFVHLDKMIDDV